jgi:hypothetical protein
MAAGTMIFCPTLETTLKQELGRNMEEMWKDGVWLLLVSHSFMSKGGKVLGPGSTRSTKAPHAKFAKFAK